MRFDYSPYDSNYYATALRRESGTSLLKWDCQRGQDSLIVQTSFEVDATEMMAKICDKLSEITLKPDVYVDVFGDVRVRYVSAASKAQHGGCPIQGKASSYTVFACKNEGDRCVVYAPKKQAMITPVCHIPHEIHIDIMEDTRTEGFLRKRTVSTGFYKLCFSVDFADEYRDGDIICQVDKLSIPVTKKMMKQGCVYIKTSQRPRIISKNKGLKLV